MRQTAFKGKHKLANKWESEPYIIISQPNKDIPVFLLRKENGGGERTLHRNLLLPIGSLPFTTDEISVTRRRLQPRKKVSGMVEHTSKSQGEKKVMMSLMNLFGGTRGGKSRG